MRLADLQPRWLSESVFIFQCPHCVALGKPVPRWLLVKTVPMNVNEQFALAGEQTALHLVPMREDAVWSIDGRDFASMTVRASVDASPSGDWHGHITNGICQ